MQNLFKHSDLLKEAETDFSIIQQKSVTNKTIKATYQMLYDMRMLKYVHKEQFVKIRSTYGRFTSDKKLAYLCEKGWIEERTENVYATADKTLPVLKAQGFNTEILPRNISGKGMINEIQNTECFIQILKIKYFHSLLFPVFGVQKVWLRPDALLVRYDEEDKKYKLTFLEIEAEKTDWHNHIERKREKYLRLAGDIEFYDMWSILARKLGFPQPDISTIKFSVYIIGNIQKKFENGFKFLKEVPSE